jgi:hypothetical protein
MTDSEIEQWVLRELEFAGSIESRELCVSSQRGIVTLGGTVPNRTSRVAAKRAALRARGVRSVVNNLRARSSGRSPDSQHVMTNTAAVGATTQSSHRARAEQTVRIY